MAMTSTRALLRAAIGAAIFVASAAALAAPPLYRITVIEPPPDHVRCIAMALNDLGRITGTCSPRRPRDGDSAVVWSEADGFSFLVAPDGGKRGDQIIPYAINNTGIVTGTFIRRTRSSAGAGRMFVWSAERGMQLFGPKWFSEDGDYHTPAAINELNEVVGHKVRPEDSSAVPFKWSPAEGFRLLRPADRRSTELMDINNQGVMVGQTALPGEYPLAAQRDAAGETQLLTPEDTLASWALAVNDLGTVAGQQDLYLPDGQYAERAVLWRPDGSLLAPDGDLPDTTLSTQFSDINNADQAVGTVQYVGSGGYVTPMPIYWDNTTGILQVPSLLDPEDPLYGVVELNEYGAAVRINLAGQIIALARIRPRIVNSVLLTPVAARLPR
jgi:hypothetical protein